MGRKRVEDLKKKVNCSFSIPNYITIVFKNVCKKLKLDYNEQAATLLSSFCIQHFSTLKEQDGCLFFINGRCEAEKRPQPISYPDILICFGLYKSCKKYTRAKEELAEIGRKG